MPDPVPADVPPLPRWLVVGFSGHRHLHGREEAVRGMVRDRLDALAARCPRLAGVCSAASGADTVFAEEMLARDADVSVVLPFGVERFARDFVGEPPGSWDRARAVITAARHLDVVHRLADDLAGAAPAASAGAAATGGGGGAGDADAGAYFEATARTVERCDVLLAVWDGRPGAGVGGTATAVEYAERLGRPVVVCHPDTGAVRTLNDAGLPPPAPATDFDPYDARRQVQAYAGAVDRAAVRHAAGARATTRRTIYLHLAAATFGAVTLSFGLFRTVQWVPSLAELCVLGAVSYLLSTRGTHYREWLPHRVRAEVCRTFLATWDVRRHPTLTHEPRPALPGQPELFGQLRRLRQADRGPVADDLAAVRDAYLRDRVDDQLAHYRSKVEAAGRSLGFYRWAMSVGSRGATAATLVGFILIVSAGDRLPVVRRGVELLAAVLPLVATATNVLMISQESSRRARTYPRVIDELTRARAAVAAAPTWDALERAVTDAEELLLQELIEWQSFVEDTEHVH